MNMSEPRTVENKKKYIRVCSQNETGENSDIQCQVITQHFKRNSLSTLIYLFLFFTFKLLCIFFICFLKFWYLFISIVFFFLQDIYSLSNFSYPTFRIHILCFLRSSPHTISFYFLPLSLHCLRINLVCDFIFFSIKNSSFLFSSLIFYF